MAFQFGGLVEQIASTATAAGTTTLVNTSKQVQAFTGTTTQTIKFPSATTMVVGQKFEIYNESTGNLTIQFQDGTIFADAVGISYNTVTSGQSLTVKLISNGTANGTWVAILGGVNSIGFSTQTPTIQKFLSGSGTYTTPTGCVYIEVEMSGAGGGGAGSGVGGGGQGGNGGNTTFGTTLLVANGGTGSSATSAQPAGGTASLGTGPIGLTETGGSGNSFSAVANIAGPSGGTNHFGGGGASGFGQGASPAAGGNGIGYGAGGGAAGGGTVGSSFGPGGSGGAAGGYLKAQITTPLSSYSYSVGAAGTAGTAGTSGAAGGAGASGVIVVREFYANSITAGVTVTASTAPTKQVFLSGSGTYIRPSNVQYITVRMSGGGGGGNAGTNGGNTTFGTSLLVANGGTNGGGVSTSGGVGGTASISSPAVGFALQGGQGSPGQATIGAFGIPGLGGSNPLGGAGAGGLNQAGWNAAANTGGGGGGGGGNGSTSAGGAGGGAGGYLEAFISNPAATYSYAVGAAGAGGPVIANTNIGGNGGSGIIEVTEYYAALATGGFTGGGANVPTVQKFLSGSGTYTTPANCLYIEVEMVGAGGGGGGSGAGAGTGGSGGATSFGTSLLAANGGTGGQNTGAVLVGGAGGTATIGAGASGNTLTGAAGGAVLGSSTALNSGGPGGSSPFGGAGGVTYATAGAIAAANTGSGGSGAGTNAAAQAGCGGGAGGYIKAVITNPLATYAYAVGASGAGGTAGTSEFAGGAGAAGIIIVREFYSNGSIGTATNVTGVVSAAHGGTGLTTSGSAGNILTADGSGGWKSAASSGGGGSKNYLSVYIASLSSGVANSGNGNFESGSATGFSLGTIGTLTNGLPTGSPTFGSGASGNLSLGVVSSNQIAGSFSGSYISSAATTVGNMVASDAFFIDKEDQGNVLTYKANYFVASGASTANWSGTASNSFGVAIFDVTNNQFLPTIGAFNLVQSSGVGLATGYVQTLVNTAQLRFCFYNVNATTGAISIYLDDISIGPQSVAVGQTAIVGSIIASASTTVPSGYLLCDGSAVSRTTYNDLFTAIGTTYGVGDGSTTFNLPNGKGVFLRGAGSQVISGITYSATMGASATDSTAVKGLHDTGHSHVTYMVGSGGNNSLWHQQPGTGIGFATGSIGDGIGPGFFQAQVANGVAALSGDAETRPANIAVNYYICYRGISLYSPDSDTRVVALQQYVGSLTPSQSIGNSAHVQIVWGGAVPGIDTHAAWSTANNWYVVPVTGYYRCSGMVLLSNPGSAATHRVFAEVSQNNSILYQGPSIPTANGDFCGAPVEIIVKCNAGDTLQLNIFQDTGATQTAVQASFCVHRLTGASALLAADSVNGTYTDTSGAVIGTSSATFTYGTKVKDSHNAYSGGTLTIPVSGQYSFKAILITNTVSLSTSQNIQIYIYKNGVQIASDLTYGTGSSLSYPARVDVDYPCLAGDLITVRVACSVSTNAATAAGFNNFCWARLGN